MRCADHDDRRACRRKRRYPDRKRAKKAVRRMRQKLGREGRRVGCYWCPHCGEYHVATQKKRSET